MKEQPEKDHIIALMFAGCGWMSPFSVGAAKAFSEIIDIQHPNVRVGGCSAGSVIATALVLDFDLDELLENMLSLYNSCKYTPFSMCDGVKRVMTEMIKSNHLHSLKNNKIPYKLNIGLSSVGLYGCTSEIVSSFRDSKHIIEVIRASCHLPIIGGILPYKVDGHCSRYYDGGVSMTFPDIENITNEKSFTITVDGRPIVNNIDIVPNIGFTIPPIWSYIPRKPHILRLFYKLGYLRAMQFLFSKNNSSKISHVLRKQQDISKINMKDIKRQINMTILTIVNEK